ncbi:MAG TPA: chemotaxis protein CheB, partial [Anaeromyxobacteraceae bacterium]|nr:chemotaxis protein CheB [Anaeromyxobacteraceae bacterium]
MTRHARSQNEQSPSGSPQAAPGHPDVIRPPAARIARSPDLVAGIGGSAGGLRALKSTMPARNGLIFGVPLRMECDHSSALAEALAKHTSMRVVQGRRGSAEHHHVYVAAPDATFTLRNESFVVGSVSRGHPADIDALLCSLAEDRRDRAAGIILSDLGGGGMVGLRAIREQGGMLDQLPDDMTQSAMRFGLADLVVAVDQMPVKVLERTQRFAKPRRAAPEDDELRPQLEPICAALKEERTGHVFSCYKETTLLRATQFFRGAKALEMLASRILPLVVVRG